MANIIVPTQTIPDFSLNEEFGLFAKIFGDPFYSLTEGSVYTVEWDGNTYTCVAESTDAVLEGSVSIGNLTDFGGSGNNEPFVIADAETLNILVSLTDTKDNTPHTITVYEGVYEPEAEPEIILKGYGKEDFKFPSETVEKVALNNTDGEEVIFSKGEVIDEPLEINLDFTNGNQTVTAPEGYLVKQATIVKPDTLTPENIVKDVEVAGVVGSAEMGSGGEETKFGGISRAINFYDIFGNIAHSYTRAEAAQLKALPEVPALDGLDANGWSCSLEDVKNAVAFLDVGARYSRNGIPAQLLVVDVVPNEKLTLYYTVRQAGLSITIDWGDGNTEQKTYANVSNYAVNVAHTYANAGRYIICLVLENLTYDSYFYWGTYSGSSSTRYSICGGNTSDNRNALISVSGGAHCANCSIHSENRLEYMDVCQSSASYLGYNCYNLKVALLDKGYTLYSPAFSSTYALKRLCFYIHYNATDVLTNVYGTEVLIHTATSMKAIKGRPKTIIFTASSVVSVSSGTFYTNCLQAIYVPDELVESYKADTYWTDYASYIKPLSEYPDY